MAVLVVRVRLFPRPLEVGTHLEHLAVPLVGPSWLTVTVAPPTPLDPSVMVTVDVPLTFGPFEARPTLLSLTQMSPPPGGGPPVPLNERQQVAMELVRRQGSVSARELSEACGVAPLTA